MKYVFFCINSCRLEINTLWQDSSCTNCDKTKNGSPQDFKVRKIIYFQIPTRLYSFHENKSPLIYLI